MQTRQSYRRLHVHVDEVLDIAAGAFMLARKRLTKSPHGHDDYKHIHVWYHV